MLIKNNLLKNKVVFSNLSKEKIPLNSFNLGDRLEVMSQIKANSVDMMITSPPYNIGKKYENYDDSLSYKDYLEFLNETWKASYRILKHGGRIANNVASVNMEGEWRPIYSDVINQMKTLEFIMRSDILWYKDGKRCTAWGSFKSPSNPCLIRTYEFILVFSKETKKHEGKKENIDITKEEFIQFSDAFWKIQAETRLSKHHPAPFPEELVYRLLKFYTYKEDIVLDPFSDSGTVALVAKKIHRNFIYIDNSKKYLDFAKNRVETSK